MHRNIVKTLKHLRKFSWVKSGKLQSFKKVFSARKLLAALSSSESFFLKLVKFHFINRVLFFSLNLKYSSKSYMSQHIEHKFQSHSEESPLWSPLWWLWVAPAIFQQRIKTEARVISEKFYVLQVSGIEY